MPGRDGSYAEVARDAHSGRQLCDAVSQDLRRATSFSNRRQQKRVHRKKGPEGLSTQFLSGPVRRSGAAAVDDRVGFLPDPARWGLVECWA
ncbi:hypothetical protein GCM10010245_09040 [Streptomyces spectabilis]|nr:hypothetical protein GCM10010245_09040 [Streptomyces spectabilis]